MKDENMNRMQEEISSLSELLFEKDQYILDLQAKIEKLEEYKETTEGLKLAGNVMLIYIRVSVVLIWSLCRKEREELDIKLDSAVFMLARV